MSILQSPIFFGANLGSIITINTTNTERTSGLIGIKFMPKHKALYGLFIVLLWGTCFLVEAQMPSIPDGEDLLYIQEMDEQIELVRLSAQYEYRYRLASQGECSSLSRLGTYNAYSASDHPSVFIVRRVASGEVLIQIDWPVNWQPCSVYWFNDTAFSVRRSDIQTSSLRYDIASGVLTEIDAVPGFILFDLPLPEQLVVGNFPEFVLPTPQTSIYLYQRCVGQFFMDDKYQQCPDGVSIVIYDTSTEQYLATLPRADPYISGVDYHLGRFVGDAGVAWSFDGRYIAYSMIPPQLYTNFNLAIFDLQTGQTIKLDFPNEAVDFNIAVSWSPQVNRLLFWLRGRLGEGNPEDDDRLLRQPIIYDVQSNTFIPIDDAYVFSKKYITDLVKWSPGGTMFAFVDAESRLILADTGSGETRIVDTGVREIANWLVNIPPQADDGDDQF